MKKVSQSTFLPSKKVNVQNPGPVKSRKFVSRHGSAAHLYATSFPRPSGLFCCCSNPKVKSLQNGFRYYYLVAEREMLRQVDIISWF